MKASNEIVFQIAFGFLWAVYFGVRLFFQDRVKGSQEYTRFNEHQEKLLFRIFAVAFLILPLYFLTAWIDLASLPLPMWLRWCGGGIVCLGITLLGWAHQVLGNNWSAVLALSKENEMVENGPYRHVRYPVYSAFITIEGGFLLLSSNWLVGVIYLVPLLVIYLVRMSPEEKMMF